MQYKGFVYAQQTMIAQYNCTGDWAFYLQGDEVVHEEDLPKIRSALEKAYRDDRVEALIFDYLHFFGGVDTIAISPAWYRKEVRVIRNTIRSIQPSDAQFFVVLDTNKKARYPRAIHSGGRIFHL